MIPALAAAAVAMILTAGFYEHELERLRHERNER